LDLLQIGGLDLVALEIELQFQVGEPALRALIHNCLAQRSTEVL
jgi:hypothetical protein